jgi:cell division protein FtsB
MKSYRRARAALVVAAIFSVLTVATGFPLATLLRQRGEIAGAVRELDKVRAHDAALQREVKSLSTRATIVAIAREDYGLVRAGERAVVILPGKNGPRSAATELTPDKLPASDFVPSAATTWEVSSSATASQSPSFWTRVFHHLEFWRGLF